MASSCTSRQFGGGKPEQLGYCRTLGGVSEHPFSHLPRVEGPRKLDGEELGQATLGKP